MVRGSNLESRKSNPESQINQNHTSMKLKVFLALSLCLFAYSTMLFSQASLGTIQNNTNAALPVSYNFQEYIYAEPDDQGTCLGTVNNSATIEGIYMAQTHRHAIGHPLFFTIGHRPALLQVAVTGIGAAPDVQVAGTMNGSSLGTLCLAGPANLAASIDLNAPNFEDYFSVTLPKNWVKDGLELVVTAGSQSSTLTGADLKIGPYTEMNLVMVNMDVLDYNGAPHQSPIFQDFLQEMASAIPASMVRFGIFPETLTFPEVVANNDTEQLVRLTSRSEMSANGINSDGYINSIAVIFLGNMHKSTGDYLSTVYFGNTLNLAPGGWGGGKNFVSPDYTDIFIHELGHALSLPHWGESAYNIPDPNPWDYLYPYGGETDDGGGRGEAWNFIQDAYEFVDPSCLVGNNTGSERSDCMQRNHACVEQRPSEVGPWDGYGDFSAIAIHRYLVGAAMQQGQVSDRGQMKDYQLNNQNGFPIASVANGERVYTRDPLQPQELTWEEQFDVPGEEQLEQEVYLLYGTAHETQAQANIVYKPIKFTGTLPPVIDPTDPSTFEALKDPEHAPFLHPTRDITLKITYEDGSILHALNPYESYDRAPYDGGFHIWRWDISNFSLVVPGDQPITKVELYKRPFCVRDPSDNTAGNINFSGHNITAANFMDGATWQAEYDFDVLPGGIGSNTIGNRVWNDLNRNGLQDDGESGIADVSLVIWRDSDGDGIPDWQGFGGVVKTDAEGYYSFSGLGPGNYNVFVWSVDNWEEGQPLHGMVSSEIHSDDPNNDNRVDNNGHGDPFTDIFAGIITLTADGEPLNDGDRESCWFDFDPSGNMTIDFAFHSDGVLAVQSIDFSAKAMSDSEVLLEWKSQGINIEEYTIQKSADPITWENMETVVATHRSSFQLIDAEPLVGDNYYRLAWTDEGTTTMSYSSVQWVNMDDYGRTIRVFPNPVGDELQIAFSSTTAATTPLRIYNTLGQTMRTDYIQHGQAEVIHHISVDDLEAGIYFVQVGRESAVRLVKL